MLLHGKGKINQFHYIVAIRVVIVQMREWYMFDTNINIIYSFNV